MSPWFSVDTERMVITFKIKGGRLHAAPLHPDLLPLVARARAENREYLVDLPADASSRWAKFFQIYQDELHVSLHAGHGGDEALRGGFFGKPDYGLCRAFFVARPLAVPEDAPEFSGKSGGRSDGPCILNSGQMLRNDWAMRREALPPGRRKPSRLMALR